MGKVATRSGWARGEGLEGEQLQREVWRRQGAEGPQRRHGRLLAPADLTGHEPQQVDPDRRRGRHRCGPLRAGMLTGWTTDGRSNGAEPCS